ncbi:sugar ABC transporter substrate-binding protein [Actinoplanes bogorensis]|uniref:Sugar ABC transporter substrate-binding protein n=1 Tax=Paractinoplanes bogorensis TaxID=1610840 RepID=A0ABS5YZR8_9ACTN|nr:sugar ABC transporter substrate-binding protein [Actinoplanes bogorensis]MBU2668888.1 sugar ABC transporter substrate-binding protein [Actinoplanes bogorensis]
MNLKFDFTDRFTRISKAATVAGMALTLAAVAACAPAEGEGTGTAGGAEGQDVSEFVTAVSEHEKGPTTFAGPTSGKPAPTGKNLAVIPCGVAVGGCNTPGEAAKAAAEGIGWKVTVYDGQANPRTQNQMVLNAISGGADAIITVAVDQKLIQQGLEAAKKAGVPVISMNNGTGTPNPQVASSDKFTFTADVSPDYGGNGKMQAEWVIAQSKGNAVVMPVVTQEYTSNTVTFEAFKKEMARCSTCKVLDPVDFTTAEIASGALGTRTVAALQSKPDVNFIYTGFDSAAAAEVTSIMQAGLANRVQLVSAVGDPINREFIRKGQVQGATVVEIPSMLGYAAIDQVIRVLGGEKVFEPQNQGAGVVLLTKNNMIGNEEPWPLAFDVKAAYHKLWGVQ